MLLGFKTRPKLNNQPRTALARHAGVARHAWNWGLALTQKILNYNPSNPKEKIKQIPFLSEIDLHQWLVTWVKSEHPWDHEISQSAPQTALRYLGLAWDQCSQKTSGAPTFKSKGRHGACELDGTIQGRGSQTMQVPPIGLLRTDEAWPSSRQPQSVTISHQTDDGLILFPIEIEPIIPPQVVDIVGVDWRVKSWVAPSTSKGLVGAKTYKQMESWPSRLPWLNRSQQRGLTHWKKAPLKIAPWHPRIAKIRKNTIHNQTKLDGAKRVIVDRWLIPSQPCSRCGTQQDRLAPSERVFDGDHCGLPMGRDRNAASNLQTVASPVVSVCRADEADFAAIEQDVS